MLKTHNFQKVSYLEMSTKFDTFEKQFGTQSADAISHLNLFEQTQDNNFLQKAQRVLDDLQDLVEQMEFESSVSRDKRKAAVQYKKEYNNIEKRWRKLREGQTREELLAKRMPDDVYGKF